MADANRNVNIKINVIGDSAAKFTSIGTGFANLATSLSNIAGNVGAVAEGLERIGAALTPIKSFRAPDLAAFTQNINKISDIDTTKVEGFVESMKAFKGLKLPANFDKFATGMEAFSKVKTLPDLKVFSEGLLSLTKVKGIPVARLGSIRTALEGFGNLSLPTSTKLPNFVTAINSLSGVKGVPTTKLTGIATALQGFKGLTFPSLGKLTEFASGVKELTKVNFTNISAFTQLSSILRNFSGITTLPSVERFANSLKALTQLDSSKIASMAQAIMSLGNSLSHLNVSTGATAGITKAGQEAEKTGKKVAEFGRSAQQAGGMYGEFIRKLRNYSIYRLIADSIIGLKEAVTAGIDEIIQYDQALRDLQAITMATDTEVTQMGSTIKEVAATTKFSAAEVAAGMRTMGQAGFSASESIQSMQAVANLATGTLSDMSTTVDLITTAMRVFELQASQSAHVADVFGNAVNRSKLTVDKLRIAMNYVGPIADEAGVTFEEMSAAMGTLANNGLRASTIGTGLRRVFGELLDPSKGFLEVIGEAGVAIEQLDPRIHSLSDVLIALDSAVVDSSQAFEAFGKRGAAAALALIDQDAGFDHMLSVINESGTAARMAAIQMEGLGVSLKNLKDKVGVLSIALGEAGLSGVLRGFINIARAGVDALTALTNSGIGGFTVQMALLAAGLTGLTVGIVAVTGALVALIPVVTATAAGSAALAGSAAALGGAFAVLTGPIGLFVAAVGVLYAGFKGVVNYASRFEGAMQSAADAAADFGNKVATLDDYFEKVTNLTEGSLELQEANLGLRDELAGVASKFSEVSDEAAIARDSINAITGEVEDNGIAIRAYRVELERLERENLSEAFENSVKGLNAQSGYLKDSIDTYVYYWDKSNLIIQGLWAGLTEGFGETGAGLQAVKAHYSRQLDELYDSQAWTRAWGTALKKGELEFEDFANYIQNLDLRGSASKHARDMAEAFSVTIEQASNLLLHLEKFGQIDMSTTVDELKTILAPLEYTELQQKAIIYQFERMQDMHDRQPKRGLEALVEEYDKARSAIQDYIDIRDASEEPLSNDERTQLTELDEEKRRIANEVKALEEDLLQGRVYSEEEAIVARQEAYKKRVELKKQLAELNKEEFNDEKLYRARRVVLLKQAFDQEVALNAERFRNNKKARDEANAQAELNLAADLKKLEVTPYDPTYLAKQTKIAIAKENKLYQERLHSISVLEAQDIDNKKDFNFEKEQEELRHYAELTRIAEDYFTDIASKEEEGSTAYTAALTAREKARADEVKAQRKSIEDAEKMRSTAQQKEKKDLKALGVYYEKFLEDRFKSRDKVLNKIKDLEEDYAEKVKDINEDLKDALTDLDEERAEQRRDYSLDLFDIEQSGADAIRKIRQRNMTDRQKDADNFQALMQKEANAVELMNKAIAAGLDGEQYIQAARSQLTSGFSLAESLTDPGKAIQNINVITEQLKKLRGIEENLNKLKNEKEKADEEAKAASKLENLKKEHEKKLKDIKEAYISEYKLNESVHRRKMDNYRIQLIEYKKQIDVANDILALEKQITEEVLKREKAKATPETQEEIPPYEVAPEDYDPSRPEPYDPSQEHKDARTPTPAPAQPTAEQEKVSPDDCDKIVQTDCAETVKENAAGVRTELGETRKEVKATGVQIQETSEDTKQAITEVGDHARLTDQQIAEQANKSFEEVIGRRKKGEEEVRAEKEKTRHYGDALYMEERGVEGTENAKSYWEAEVAGKQGYTNVSKEQLKVEREIAKTREDYTKVVPEDSGVQKVELEVDPSGISEALDVDPVILEVDPRGISEALDVDPVILEVDPSGISEALDDIPDLEVDPVGVDWTRDIQDVDELITRMNNSADQIDLEVDPSGITDGIEHIDDVLDRIENYGKIELEVDPSGISEALDDIPDLELDPRGISEDIDDIELEIDPRGIGNYKDTEEAIHNVQLDRQALREAEIKEQEEIEAAINRKKRAEDGYYQTVVNGKQIYTNLSQAQLDMEAKLFAGIRARHAERRKIQAEEQQASQEAIDTGQIKSIKFKSSGLQFEFPPETSAEARKAAYDALTDGQDAIEVGNLDISFPDDIEDDVKDDLTKRFKSFGLEGGDVKIAPEVDVQDQELDAANEKADELGKPVVIPVEVEISEEDRQLLQEYEDRFRNPTNTSTTQGTTAFYSGGLVGSLIQAFATGGQVFKQAQGVVTMGTGAVDDVYAKLTRDEFVQPVSAVRKYGVHMMEMIRRGLFPVTKAFAYAEGGMAGYTSDILNSIGSVSLDSSDIVRAVGGLDIGAGNVSNVSNYGIYFGDNAFDAPDDVRSPALDLLDAVQRRM